MKKILLSILALAAAFSAYCQDDSTLSTLSKDIKEAVKGEVEYDPLIAQSDNGVLRLYTSSHVGYGLYGISTEAFEPSLSWEFFVNLCRFGLYPTDYLGFEVNADLGLNSIRSRKTILALDGDRDVIPLHAGEYLPSNSRRFRSGLDFVSLNFPLFVKYNYEDFAVGAGTEISMNFAGRTNYKYAVGNDHYSTVQKRADINLFTYALIATMSYKDLGFFIKFYPKYAGILSNKKLDMSYVVVGVSFGL